MFKYWTAFESEEHCLYAHEVAAMWQIYTCSATSSITLNNLLTGELLKEAGEALGKDAIFYETKTGLRRVYDHETINYATRLLVDRRESEGAVSYCRVKSKRYKYVMGEDNIHNALVQLYPEHFEDDGARISRRDTMRLQERKQEIRNRKKANK